MKKNSFKSSFVILLIILIIYSFLSISLFQYKRLTADCTIFLSIAEKYVSGDFHDAINGYWGPLLSWLFIPFLYFGSTHLFAVNGLSLIIGVLTIIGIWILSYRFEMTERIRSIILFLLLPIILHISLIQSQDLLLLCILVYYLGVVFKNDYPDGIYNGILSGILGALAYFSKSYAFPFFISHFLLINILHYLRGKTKINKRNVLRNAFAGIVMFSIISGVWIFTLSNKYNHITFSTAGKFNFAVVSPEAAGIERKGQPWEALPWEKGLPILYGGFLEPPNKTSIVAWEDPTYLEVKPWSPFESWSNIKYLAKHILKNSYQIIFIFEFFSPLSIAIILIYILFCIQPFNKLILRSDILFPILTLFLYSGGYTPIFVAIRYLWIAQILLLLMAGCLLNVLFQNKFFNPIRKNILIVIFILSFIVSPLKSINNIKNGNTETEMYTLSMKLKDQHNIQGNIASNREHISSHTWGQTYLASYFLNSRYYGQAKENISDSDLKSELRKYDIDYYFVWGESTEVPQFLSQYREVTGGVIPYLKIFSLEEKGAPSESDG